MLNIVGSDAIRRDGARTLLYNRFGTTHTLPSIGAFLDLAFGGPELGRAGWTTFGELLARLHRYYRGTGCRPLTRMGRAERPGGADAWWWRDENRGGGRPIHGGLGVVGGDALGRGGVRAILGAGRTPAAAAFLDLVFGGEERITFDEFLAQLYRYYRHAGCSLVRTERSGECCELLPATAGGGSPRN